jgi:hypothetical protein
VPSTILSLLAVALAIPAAIVQASFFEWTIHRYWMHRPARPKDPFVWHTLVHHQLCKYDDTFVIRDEEQSEAMTFAWWHGPALIGLNVLPWIAVAIGLGAAGVGLPFVGMIVAFAITFGLYYAGYEGLHYLMHKPTLPAIEHTRVFRYLEKHHRIHHARMDRNLNVLLPLADRIMGTYVAEMPAAQATPPGARERARQYSHYGKRLREGGRS